MSFTAATQNVLDIGLLRLDGYEVARPLRQ